MSLRHGSGAGTPPPPGGEGDCDGRPERRRGRRLSTGRRGRGIARRPAEARPGRTRSRAVGWPPTSKIPRLVRRPTGGGGGAAVGAVAASGPVDGAGVIHGCWTTAAVNGTHTFVLRNASARCPKNTTAISWNQTGPKGATGATGPQGPTGPSTAGPTGLDVTSMQSSGTAQATADCPPDHPYAIGGEGYTLDPGVAVAAGPNDTKPTGWYAVASSPTSVVYVYAVCAK